MSKMGVSGYTPSTPGNIPLSAGTIHKNFKWNADKQEWEGPIIGATSGGNSVEIKGEIFNIEIDGVKVKVKGLAVMNGGTGIMEVNFAEITEEILAKSMIAEAGESDAPGYTMLQPKSTIEEGDFIENFAFVGKTAKGNKSIIVIFDNALCTSGFKLEGKGKENSVIKLTMETYADDDGDLESIPVRIYYPEQAAE